LSEAVVSYLVKGMSCKHCKSAVEKAVRSVDGVIAADVNLPTGEVVVRLKDPAAAGLVRDAIIRSGYEVATVQDKTT